MARLTAAQRRALPNSAFADPKNRKFPDFDADHQRAALMDGATGKTKANVLKKMGKTGLGPKGSAIVKRMSGG